MLPLYAVSMCAFCLHGVVKIVVRLAAILLKKGTVKQNDVVASHKHAWRFHEPLKNKNGYILVINSLRNHINNGLLVLKKILLESQNANPFIKIKAYNIYLHGYVFYTIRVFVHARELLEYAR